jgi:hypothetical protein
VSFGVDDTYRQSVPQSLTRLDLFRDSEIRNLDSTLVVHEDVRTLDISMDDLALVQIVETGKDLSNKIAYKRFLECAIIVEQGGDRSTGNVLEENVKVVGIS